MAIPLPMNILRFIRGLGGVPGGDALSDGQLLGRFLAARDEHAFTTLLQRHGPLVLGVCRQVLGDVHAAEDVFQATFLVLARKAASVRRRASLGAWLYRVACNLAVETRRGDARRRVHEQRAQRHRAAEAVTEADWSDWQQTLHEEVNRLPTRYRVPVVLCYLVGKSHEEAAQELRWPVGTVKGRLSRARDLLRVRLTRRGLALSASGLAWAMAQHPAQAAVPAELVVATAQAARWFAAGKTATVGAGAASAIHLATGALTNMAIVRLSLLGLLLLALGTAGTVGVLLAYQAPEAPGASAPAAPVAPQPPAVAPVPAQQPPGGKVMAESKVVTVNKVDFQAVAEAKVFAPVVGGKRALDIGLRITNQSLSPFSFNLFDTMHVSLQTADGKAFPVLAARKETDPAKPILIGSMEKQTVWRDAHLEVAPKGLSLIGPDGSGGIWECNGLLPGKYRLAFTYENNEKTVGDYLKSNRDFGYLMGISFWFGKVTTEAVEFEIVPPPKTAADLMMAPLDTVIAQLDAADGTVRVAATQEIFRRGKEVLPLLKKAGATQVAPFGGTITTRRLDMIYSLLEGLPPSPPAPAAGYQEDAFGLHVTPDTTQAAAVAMGEKHGFLLQTKLSLDANPSCYCTIKPGKTLAAVLRDLLTSEPSVTTVNLNYREAAQVQPKPAALAPLTYKDDKTGLLFVVESDRRHVAALDKNGKVLWHKDLIAAANLKGYKVGTKVYEPAITHLGPPLDWMLKTVKAQGKTGDFVEIAMGKYFGVFNQRTGEYTFMGND
jgi:RNA polymerase sigma-70 factor (ECF subfamily)